MSRRVQEARAGEPFPTIGSSASPLCFLPPSLRSSAPSRSISRGALSPLVLSLLIACSGTHNLAAPTSARICAAWFVTLPRGAMSTLAFSLVRVCFACIY
ncbi:hypothetical protein AURDEDRAFT_176728 [Auricularia subglabra TFB-10046 SS5]|uniref:Uncharacterized protein n=1 Tax=Auricularia subglabra (strain TFB-10046 / SS5) TaxID=717982 RepID=J0CV00_AURST|nr:hypothetical protein AURDEDRAFT_176728 [Auricularia subglabra TFB-10046 SS5]